MYEQHPGVFTEDNRFYTRNANPGTAVYGEDCVNRSGVEYRAWNPHRSKLAAALHNGLSDTSFTAGSRVLYLGAATGTTVSHIADICRNGLVIAVEVSEDPMEKLLDVARNRSNIAPVLANARNPDEYAKYLETVDVLYQDIAQQDQADIFTKNKQFLSPEGTGLLCIKAQSISSTRNPDAVLDDAVNQLEGSFAIEETVDLAPFHTDHLFVRCKPRN